MSQLLAIIRSVHQAGLLHRDIKPANVILRDDDRVVLTDFGSSRALGSGLTQVRTQIYSTGYAPLEQMIGLPQGQFSDIYAIGAVCYDAIGGKLVDAMTRHHAQSAGKVDPQPLAKQIGSRRYPLSLLRAIDAALIINPKNRPQSVAAVLAILSPDQSEAETVKKPPNPSVLNKPRSPLRRGVAALACALVLTGMIYFVSRHTGSGRNPKGEEVASQQADDGIRACDALAASPLDKMRPSGAGGVEFNGISTSSAIPACERAVASHPTSRAQFQLGRSYDAARRYAEAARLYKLAAGQGYAAGRKNLGQLYEDGHGVDQSWPEAAHLHKLAAARGIEPAKFELQGHEQKHS